MTGSDALVIEPLGGRHDRVAFSCGLPGLDRYLARQAGQDVRCRIARVFVCNTGDTDAVLGFYTPALSVDPSARGRCIGRVLVADAVMWTVAAGETVAMHALIVDAANQGPGLPDAGEAFLRARPT